MVNYVENEQRLTLFVGTKVSHISRGCRTIEFMSILCQGLEDGVRQALSPLTQTANAMHETSSQKTMFVKL
jgi:hypothetical protein